MDLRTAGRRLARRYEGISIASMRFHWVLPSREVAAERYKDDRPCDKHLWGYTRRDSAADACLRAIEAELDGHEVFYIAAPDTTSPTPSRDLAAQHFPHVPIRGALPGRSSLMSSAKAERLLGWVHPGSPV
jgi:nucleoside-diphosphate-sugar epimerase